MNSSDIARTYGVTICSDRDPKEYCNWDGKQLNTKGMKEEGIIHELSHWLISDKRHLPDYGLGAGPDTNSQVYTSAMEKLGFTVEDEEPFYIYDKAETLACVMEFIHAALGEHDMQKYMEARFFLKKNGRWDDTTGSSYEEFIGYIICLQSKNIINEDWIPNLLHKFLSENELEGIHNFRKMVEEIW